MRNIDTILGFFQLKKTSGKHFQILSTFDAHFALKVYFSTIYRFAPYLIIDVHQCKMITARSKEVLSRCVRVHDLVLGSVEDGVVNR